MRASGIAPNTRVPNRFCLLGVLALLAGVSILAAGEELTVASASFTVRTDVAFGSYGNPDSYVLIYGFASEDEGEQIESWLLEFSFVDLKWRTELEAELPVEPVGFTQPVGDSKTPVWDTELDCGNHPWLLLLVIDEDIKFDDPIGYLLIGQERFRETELWVEGLGEYRGQKIGKIVVGVR